MIREHRPPANTAWPRTQLTTQGDKSFRLHVGHKSAENRGFWLLSDWPLEILGY
jgi:hypothetical protein